jgi:hypothetical protein
MALVQHFQRTQLTGASERNQPGVIDFIIRVVLRPRLNRMCLRDCH